MKNEQGYTVFELVIVIVGLLGAGGWIANIVKLVSVAAPVAQWGAFEVLRVIGIFVAPLGAVLGFV